MTPDDASFHPALKTNTAIPHHHFLTMFKSSANSWTASSSRKESLALMTNTMAATPGKLKRHNPAQMAIPTVMNRMPTYRLPTPWARLDLTELEDSVMSEM